MHIAIATTPQVKRSANVGIKKLKFNDIFQKK
jgi:hypothetical protein